MATGLVGLEKFAKHIKRIEGKVENHVTDKYKAFTLKILRELAENTPQWSGDLAASWQVVVGKGSEPVPNYSTPLKVIPWKSLTRTTAKFKGDDAAVVYAMEYSLGQIQLIRWNSHVKIVNTNPTVAAIEGKTLRPDNYFKGDVMALHFVANKWGNRGVGLTPSK